jgi:tocopherol O-methyltransferase
MIVCPTVEKTEIRSHYNLCTPFYRLFWGPHIHHGLWEGTESSDEAQLQLTRTMVERIGIRPGSDVLDVGCGMGGSSIYLAREEKCHVTGVTLSPVQRTWASLSARRQGVAGSAKFVCADAEKIAFPANSFDVLWSIECTEHLFDKPAFFQRAAKWLRPGGRVGICAWLAGDMHPPRELEEQVYRVCEGFLCPSLGATEDYQNWMEQAGLVSCSFDDWTDRVAQTWEICKRRVERSRVAWLAKPFGINTVRFLDSFETILEAYRSGAMKYGCFVFEKPLDSPNCLATETLMPEVVQR